MPENVPKMPLSASPIARSGAGDISERELSRERHNLRSTPVINRSQPTYPKKHVCSAPVNKFTGKTMPSNKNLVKIKRCLDSYMNQTPLRPVKIGPKAVSMEDLTPTKKGRREKNFVIARSPLHSVAEEQAAARVGRFMLVATWRRRREEVRCLRKTLEFQINCSEKLRMQVLTLKYLLDSDNEKVRLAMRELDRLKKLLHDKEMEKAVLEREKIALEGDVCAAEDRASEMSIGWHNCRNELEGILAANAVCEHTLSLERASTAEARAQRDHAYARISLIEDELSQHEALLSSAETEVADLRREAEEKQRKLEYTSEQLKSEKEARERCTRECSLLNLRVTIAAEETNTLKRVVEELRAELNRLDAQLTITRKQLEWWPRPLTKMLGAARSWFRHPLTVPEAVLWSLVPSRHGC